MKLHRLLLLTCIIGLGSCATSPEGRMQLKLMSSSNMDKLGAQSFEQMKQELKTSTDRRKTAYVQCIADAIIPQLKKNNDPSRWEVVLFADDQANAFALPGNKIGVYEGLLKYAVNQHQVATVMGHEVAHVIAEHGNERVSQQMATGLGIKAAGVVLGSDSERDKKILLGLGIGLQYGVVLPFSRSHESEADLIGLDLMAKAGFDPRESVPLWENMSSSGQNPPEFMSTHPSGKTRIRDLNKRMTRATQFQQEAHAAGRRPDCRI